MTPSGWHNRVFSKHSTVHASLLFWKEAHGKAGDAHGSGPITSFVTKSTVTLGSSTVRPGGELGDSVKIRAEAVWAGKTTPRPEAANPATHDGEGLL